MHLPEEYWKAAKLMGRTPFYACQADPRISYCMYIPAKYDEALSDGQRMPLIVNVHGSSRRAQHHRDILIDLAESEGCAILAPLFPCGVDGPNDSHGYKFLAAGTKSARTRYDRILLSIIDEVAVRWPSIEVSKFYLTGYSGGGQFALRFFYLHPDKLEAVWIGAPGMITRLDKDTQWPWGIEDVEEYFDGRNVDVTALLTVRHIQLLVGSDDVSKVNDGPCRTPVGIAGFEAVRPTQIPGKLLNRVESVGLLHSDFKALGIRSEFVIVPNVAHSSDGVAPDLVRWLKRVLHS